MKTATECTTVVIEMSFPIPGTQFAEWNETVQRAMSKPSLRGMRTFCIAARHESFRDAAEELFITASAVSHQVKNLEAELGVTLFDRSRRSLRLTETGRSMFEDVEPLIEQLDKAATRYRRTEVRKTLRISVQPFFASEMFVPRLAEFTELHPQIDLRVDTSDESSEKLPPGADVSIRLFRSPPADVRSDLLLPLRLQPAGSPDFRDSVSATGKVISGEFPMIVHETRPTAWTEWSVAAGVRLPEVRKTIRLDSMIAVVKAAEQGLGAALVPMPLANDWFDDGSLVPLFDTELVVEDGYYIVCTRDRWADDHVRSLTNWVVDTFPQSRDMRGNVTTRRAPR